MTYAGEQAPTQQDFSCTTEFIIYKFLVFSKTLYACLKTLCGNFKLPEHSVFLFSPMRSGGGLLLPPPPLRGGVNRLICTQKDSTDCLSSGSPFCMTAPGTALHRAPEFPLCFSAPGALRCGGESQRYFFCLLCVLYLYSFYLRAGRWRGRSREHPPRRSRNSQ